MRSDDQGTPNGQPAGFAAPQAQPLGGYTTVTLALPGDTPDPIPTGFAVTGDAGPRLDQVAPAPPDVRDPHQPFAASQDDQLPGVAGRDPREPFVTTSVLGTPDFAPPTGAPIAAAAWAPPVGAPVPVGTWSTQAPPHWAGGAGSNVGAIARPDPYVQHLEMLRSGRSTPSPAPAPYVVPTPWDAPAPAPWGYLGAPQGTSRAPFGHGAGANGQAEAEYRASSGVATLGVVLKAVPWPVLVILLAGIVLPGWTIYALCLSWIICVNSVRAARRAVNRTFMIAAGVFVLTWVLQWATQDMNNGANMTFYSAYQVMGQWLCGILIGVVPVIVWRGLESSRRS